MPVQRNARTSASWLNKGFSNVFGSATKPPVGYIRMSRENSGYFGNWRGERPSQGKQIVFHLNALPEHAGAVEKAKTQGWARKRSLAHTGLWVFPNKTAVLTVIQPTVDLKKSGLPSRERGRYRYSMVATTMATIEYCRRKGIRLYAVHPNYYEALHDQASGSMGSEIVGFYKKTLHNAAKGLGMAWAGKYTNEDLFVAGQAPFFGAEILQLVPRQQAESK